MGESIEKNREDFTLNKSKERNNSKSAKKLTGITSYDEKDITPPRVGRYLGGDKNEEMEINSVERYENLIKKMTAQNIFLQKTEEDMVEVIPVNYKNIPVPAKYSPFQDKNIKRQMPTLTVENMVIRKTSSAKNFDCISIEDNRSN